jgi:hypothetical protein
MPKSTNVFPAAAAPGADLAAAVAAAAAAVAEAATGAGAAAGSLQSFYMFYHGSTYRM